LIDFYFFGAAGLSTPAAFCYVEFHKIP